MLKGRGEYPEGKVGYIGAKAEFKSPFECNIPESVTRTASTPDNQQPKRISLDLSSRSGSTKSISHEEAARLRILLQVGTNRIAIAMHRKASFCQQCRKRAAQPYRYLQTKCNQGTPDSDVQTSPVLYMKQGTFTRA